MRYFVLIFLLLISFSNFAQILNSSQPSHLIALRVGSIKSVSHFTFMLSKKTHGVVKLVSNPDRLIVDLANTNKQFHIPNLKLKDPNVATIRELSAKNRHIVVVFFLKRKVKWKFYSLPPLTFSGAQLKLEIEPAPSLDNLSSQQLRNAFKNEILKTFSGLAAESHNARKTTIVIDPGHGGKDPGARGVAGIKEKDVVLAIAKQLVKEINQTKNMRAILTRKGDYFVSLRKRLDLARQQNAHLFIAIHADAYFTNNKKGASVFALSQHGATSEAARWLAQRDNYSELGEVELNALQDRSSLLRGVLIDLAQTATIRDSIRLGNKVLDALEDISSLHYKHVEQAPFVVLKSPDIPSILVETGFISNPFEEARLTNPFYQQKMAHALWQGIQNYETLVARWE